MRSLNWGIGAVGSVLLLLALANPAAAAASAPPPPEYQAKVIDQYVNAYGDPIILRQGYYNPPSKGLGHDKIVGKHNLRNLAVLQEVAENPDTVKGELGNAWVHRTMFALEQCDNSGCHEVDRRTVRMVIDYDPFALKPSVGQIGIVTAYCEGEVRCVDWINRYGGASVQLDAGVESEPTYRVVGL